MTTIDATPLLDAECEFVMDVTAPGLARAFVARTLEVWRVPAALLDDAETMAGELVTNAVRHATMGGSIKVWLYRAAGLVRCDVVDRDPSMRPVAVAGALTATDREAGRGLRVVAALATRFGIEAAENGKSVWFELVVPGERRFSEHRSNEQSELADVS